MKTPEEYVKHWLGAGQRGVQPVLPWTLLWDLQERHTAAGTEEGDRGHMVSWLLLGKEGN